VAAAVGGISPLVILMAEKIRPSEQMLELNEEEALFSRAFGFASAKSAGAVVAAQAPAGTDRETKTRARRMSRKQEELEHSRTDMTDKLTRSLVVLEREAYDAQKRLEQTAGDAGEFGQHLELIEAIDPKSWNPSDLHKELSRALSTVDDARTEFSQQRSRLQAAGENTGGDIALPEAAPDLTDLSGGRSLFQWVQIGFALSLPLIISASSPYLFSSGWPPRRAVDFSMPRRPSRSAMPIDQKQKDLPSRNPIFAIKSRNSKA